MDDGVSVVSTGGNSTLSFQSALESTVSFLQKRDLKVVNTIEQVPIVDETPKSAHAQTNQPDVCENINEIITRTQLQDDEVRTEEEKLRRSSESECIKSNDGSEKEEENCAEEQNRSSQQETRLDLEGRNTSKNESPQDQEEGNNTNEENNTSLRSEEDPYDEEEKLLILSSIRKRIFGSEHYDTSTKIQPSSFLPLSNPDEENIQHQCDFDVNPTELFYFIQNKQWNDAINRCYQNPVEARTWVSRLEKDGETLRWCLLPLHAAIIFMAPKVLVQILIQTYPDSAKFSDDRGNLPIHLAVDRESETLVLMLLVAYPDSIERKDCKGRTPLDKAKMSQSKKKDLFIRALEKGPNFYSVGRYANYISSFRRSLKKRLLVTLGGRRNHAQIENGESDKKEEVDDAVEDGAQTEINVTNKDSTDHEELPRNDDDILPPQEVGDKFSILEMEVIETKEENINLRKRIKELEDSLEAEKETDEHEDINKQPPSSSNNENETIQTLQTQNQLLQTQLLELNSELEIWSKAATTCDERFQSTYNKIESQLQLALSEKNQALEERDIARVERDDALEKVKELEGYIKLGGNTIGSQSLSSLLTSGVGMPGQQHHLMRQDPIMVGSVQIRPSRMSSGYSPNVQQKQDNVDYLIKKQQEQQERIQSLILSNNSTSSLDNKKEKEEEEEEKSIKGNPPADDDKENDKIDGDSLMIVNDFLNAMEKEQQQKEHECDGRNDIVSYDKGVSIMIPKDHSDDTSTNTAKLHVTENVSNRDNHYNPNNNSNNSLPHTYSNCSMISSSTSATMATTTTIPKKKRVNFAPHHHHSSDQSTVMTATTVATTSTSSTIPTMTTLMLNNKPMVTPIPFDEEEEVNGALESKNSSTSTSGVTGTLTPGTSTSTLLDKTARVTSIPANKKEAPSVGFGSLLNVDHHNKEDDNEDCGMDDIKNELSLDSLDGGVADRYAVDYVNSENSFEECSDRHSLDKKGIDSNKMKKKSTMKEGLSSVDDCGDEENGYTKSFTDDNRDDESDYDSVELFRKNDSLQDYGTLQSSSSSSSTSDVFNRHNQSNHSNRQRMDHDSCSNRDDYGDMEHNHTSSPTSTFDEREGSQDYDEDTTPSSSFSCDDEDDDYDSDDQKFVNNQNKKGTTTSSNSSSSYKKKVINPLFMSAKDSPVEALLGEVEYMLFGYKTSSGHKSTSSKSLNSGTKGK